MEARHRLHAVVSSERLVAADHIDSPCQPSMGIAGVNSNSNVSRPDARSTHQTDAGNTYVSWLGEGDPVTTGPTSDNAQPSLLTALPGENVTSFGVGCDKPNVFSEIHAPVPTASNPVTLPAQLVAPTQSLALSTNAAFNAFPASFNANAYSSAGANARPQRVAGANVRTQTSTQNNITASIALPTSFEVAAKPMTKDGGGLAFLPLASHSEHARLKLKVERQILPDIISSDSELWAQAKRAIMQRLRFSNKGYGACSGIQCILDPPLMAWMEQGTLRRFSNCMSRIYKVANPPGAQRMLDAHLIMAKMGKRSSEGGFDPETSETIANSFNHMLKHMMWAFDLVEMQKNNYEHFVPADRYRFTRMLGLVPNGKVALEFDIVSTDGPTKGQKTGVWKGTLDQLSDEKGDQRKIPNKIQCELLLEETFGEHVEGIANSLRLSNFVVRECFADENVDLYVRYRRALEMSR